MNLYGSQPWNKETAQRTAPEKRPWVVILGAEDLINRAFRTVDVERNIHWCEEGMVIWNSSTGEVRVYRNGRFVVYKKR